MNTLIIKTSGKNTETTSRCLKCGGLNSEMNMFSDEHVSNKCGLIVSTPDLYLMSR